MHSSGCSAKLPCKAAFRMRTLSSRDTVSMLNRMMNPRRFFPICALVCIAAQLSGCATLSEQQCLTADWESIGYQDGSRGYDAGRIASHTEACTEHAVRVDSQQYEEGRKRGLELFCTGPNGVRVGRQGGNYSGVCPADLEPIFLRGYDLGREINRIEAHMQQLRSDIQRTQARLQSDGRLNDDERNYLLYRLRDLEREYGRSEARLRSLERDAR